MRLLPAHTNSPAHHYLTCPTSLKLALLLALTSTSSCRQHGYSVLAIKLWLVFSNVLFLTPGLDRHLTPPEPPPSLYAKQHSFSPDTGRCNSPLLPAMVSDDIYDVCLPLLQDVKLDEEEKTEKVEELLRKETTLSGRSLEEVVLSVLWRFKESNSPSKASPPVRHTAVRRASPAPWQIPRATTPLASPPINGASPHAPPGFGVVPPAFKRTKSSIASPFTSPRPSPRLAFASPIPHSPNLNAYEFSEPSAQNIEYGDLGSETVDWLVNDDSPSRPSSSGAGSGYESGLNGAAAAWIQPQQMEMSPYDMIRSVLGDQKTDEEIETALEANAYDLSTTIATLMGGQASFEEQTAIPAAEGQVLIGKSMTASQPISIAQPDQNRSNIICKYWLSTGSCLRADCRFSHDLSSHICK